MESLWSLLPLSSATSLLFYYDAKRFTPSVIQHVILYVLYSSFDYKATTLSGLDILYVPFDLRFEMI